MKIKTSELIGSALDWAVAVAYGLEVADGVVVWFNDAGMLVAGHPSENWAQGGPIIERERIWVCPNIAYKGCGNAWEAISLNGRSLSGPTMLIAAMRCYVASKMDDEVDVPEELL